MPPDPLVSVVTTSFNQAGFLEQAIRSVIRQDYPHIEYLITDGGSTDGSQEIIRRYESDIARWNSEPDRGQADGINKGLQRANGEILAWLNSDDIYLPGGISAAVQAFNENPDCDLVFSNLLAIDAESKPINLQYFSQRTLLDFLSFQIIGQPAVFFRRRALEKAGFLDLSYHGLLDHHLWIRIARQGAVKYIHQTWSAARFHSGAKNSAQALIFGQEAFRLIEWMKNEPDLASIYRQNRRRILAGAFRLNAFYQLDAGKPRDSLRSYLRSFFYHPATAWQDKKRIAFAAAGILLNPDVLRVKYLQNRQKRMETFLGKDRFFYE